MLWCALVCISDIASLGDLLMLTDDCPLSLGRGRGERKKTLSSSFCATLFLATTELYLFDCHLIQSPAQVPAQVLVWGWVQHMWYPHGTIHGCQMSKHRPSSGSGQTQSYLGQTVLHHPTLWPQHSGHTTGHSLFWCNSATLDEELCFSQIISVTGKSHPGITEFWQYTQLKL